MSALRGQLKEVLKHLGDREVQSIFSIHDRFRISPDVILDCIRYLVSRGIVESKDRDVRIADNFSEEQIAEIVHIFLSSELNLDEDGRFIVTPKIDVDELYMPRLDLLGKELTCAE